MTNLVWQGLSAMTATKRLYDTDFHAWTQDQAAALRRAAQQPSNLGLDFDLLAEEIEDMGSEIVREIGSRLRVILTHLLLLELSPARDPRAHWASEIAEQRVELDGLLERNPGLRQRVPTLYGRASGNAIKAARLKLVTYGELDRHAMPDACLYTLEQVLDEDWFPINRHGLKP